MGVDNRSDVREFLSSRRARLTPEEAGLPVFGANRRVPGLRREEVALLAGVSVEYYVRLERGNLAGVSTAVLEALANALRLDEAERSHLFDLAAAASTHPRRTARPRVRPPVQWLLDAMDSSAAYVRNARTDILAANSLAKALYAPVFEQAAGPNIARFLFLEPSAQEFFADWDVVAHEATGLLRTMAGANPYDAGLTELVGELSTRSPYFRQLWAVHEVRLHRNGIKRFHHPLVGDLTLSYEGLDVATDAGLRLNAYIAEPGTDSAQRFALLASWSASPSVPSVPSVPGG